MKYNIAEKLNNGKPELQVADDFVIVINNSFKAVLKMQEELSSDKYKSDIERMTATLNCLLKKEDVKRIESMDLSFTDYLTIVQYIIALASGQSVEDIQKRFQQ